MGGATFRPEGASSVWLHRASQHFTRKRTNATLHDRCEALQPVWVRMARSHAPRSHKQRAIRTKAWPSALHTGAITQVADHILDRLRAGCMRGLRLVKPGMNAIAFLSLFAHPSHDPEYYLLHQGTRQCHGKTASPRSYQPDDHQIGTAGVDL